MEKITLDALMARKEQLNGKKKKRVELFVKSLNGTITIEEPTRSILADAMNFEDSYRGDVYAVYACTVEPNLHDAELQKTFDCVDPLEIVDHIFLPGEVSMIAREILDLAGYGDEGVRKVVEDTKN